MVPTNKNVKSANIASLQEEKSQGDEERDRKGPCEAVKKKEERYKGKHRDEPHKGYGSNGPSCRNHRLVITRRVKKKEGLRTVEGGGGKGNK